jgi:hypothetical protein
MIRTIRQGFCVSVVLCAIGIASGPRASGQTDDRGGDYYPVQPEQLLALLPAPPQNWKLTFSMARERISYALQPETLAMRKYLFVPPPPPPGTPPAPPGPPKEVTVTLLDTGHDPERMGSFANFKPDTDPTSSRILIQGFDAIRVSNDPSSFLTVKVSDRFILSVQFDNLKQPGIDVWTQWLQLPKIADASNAAPSVPLVSGTISLAYIDEFKPSTNFTSKASFQTKADLKKTQSRH